MPQSMENKYIEHISTTNIHTHTHRIAQNEKQEINTNNIGILNICLIYVSI